MKEHLGLIGIRITALTMIVALAGFAGPTAAQADSSSPEHRSTISGEDLGPVAWHSIAAADSHVRYDDPDRVKTRKAAIIKGRYTEFMTLGTGGVLTYDQLLDKQSYFGTSHDMSLGGQSRSTFCANVRSCSIPPQ